MRKFKKLYLQKLPESVQKRVIRIMRPMEIISLSLISRKLKKIVKDLEIPAISLTFRGDQNRLYLVLAPRSSLNFHVNFDAQNFTIQPYMHHKGPSCRFPRVFRKKISILDGLQWILEHLVEVLAIDKIVFGSENGKLLGEQLNDFVMNYRWDKLWITDPKLDLGIISKILIDFRHVDFLELGEKLECLKSGFEFQGPLQYPKMILHSMAWINFDAILYMSCEMIRFSEGTLSGMQINAILHKWLDFKFEQLKIITIPKNTHLFYDINPMRGVPVDYSRTRPRVMGEGKFEITCAKGALDIKRSDGKMATVFLGEFSEQFHFYVWDDDYSSEHNYDDDDFFI